MSHRVKALIGATGLIATLSTSGASAQALTQFASFLYNSQTSDVIYSNMGSVQGTNIPIRFEYNPGAVFFGGTAGNIGTTYDAALSFTGTTASPVVSFFGFGGQNINITSFSIIGSSGVVTGQNLLSGSLLNVSVLGTLGGATANISGDVLTGSSIMYTSSYLMFPTIPPATNAGFSWALNNVSPPLGIQGNNFRDFTSTVQGGFSYTAVVPEPGQVASLVMGGAGLALVLWKRRKG